VKSIVNEIENKVKYGRRGKILFASDFSSFGLPKAVNKAMERLTESGMLIRLAQGIYLYPKMDTRLGLGILYPTVETIAREIAKRDKARIVPTGAYALNVLGLSTQIPMNVVFLTDGAPRKISIGNGKGIVFKRTVPKNLAFKNNMLMLIVTALREIGEKRLTAEQLNRIADLLSKEKKEDIRAEIALAPAWIQKRIKAML
jgi:predicted transcriptional regulator of viral defense system